MASKVGGGIGSRPGAWLALCAAAALCTGGVSAFQAPPNAADVRVQFLSPPALYGLIGGGANSLALERDDGVVIVDPKAAGWGATVLGILKGMMDQPVTTVVVTNGDPEHAGAAGEFGAARIVAHEFAARRMKASGVSRLPTDLVRDKLSLFGAAPRVDVYYFGKGHTDGDLVVAFPDAGIVHMGDLFPKKAAPVIDVANGGSGVAFPDTLDRVVREFKGVRRVTASHDAPPRRVAAELLSWKDLEDYAEFNRLFLEKVREAIAAGLTASQAAMRLEMPEKFKSYDMQQAPANVAAIYKELGH